MNETVIKNLWLLGALCFLSFRIRRRWAVRTLRSVLINSASMFKHSNERSGSEMRQLILTNQPLFWETDSYTGRRSTLPVVLGGSPQPIQKKCVSFFLFSFFLLLWGHIVVLSSKFFFLLCNSWLDYLRSIVQTLFSPIIYFKVREWSFFSPHFNCGRYTIFSLHSLVQAAIFWLFYY